LKGFYELNILITRIYRAQKRGEAILLSPFAALCL
jgi:hypothetical protein